MTYDGKPTVELLYTNETKFGPGKVVKNLKAGLERIGVHVCTPYSSDVKPEDRDYVGCLQSCHRSFLEDYKKKSTPVLMGPNLFVLPSDDKWLATSFTHYVVPSKWVRQKYYQFPEMKTKRIHIWPVGVDTDVWKPTKSPRTAYGQPLDCFIYTKNRSEQDLNIAQALLRRFNLDYSVLRYGHYQEAELWRLCQRAKFCVVLDGTESQGLATMQIMSTGTPCYVFNNPVWKSEDGQHQFSATSVPYWDASCGKIAQDISIDHFQEFLDELEGYDPRSYILQKHTLEKAAKRYYDLLKVSKGEQNEVPPL